MTKFYEGISEILEVDAALVNRDFDLHSGDAGWDSLAIVSVIALIDEIYDLSVDGKLLGECETVGHIEDLIKKAQAAL
ncbi:acyl carrier protein [Curvibacter sp. RS43]|uniref:acyl carrier protein n=1 Tax=Curvibacter microcysteis TaxID=3026419 RepID=UPI0023624936|nr:acyl carrier protein [Curvibacter sp. RS43]MDD0811807.1 acyl carrier protein [Curvibacter sp. RS43]